MTSLDGKQVIAQWTAHAPGVLAYTLTLEPNWSNAEDILQETAVTVWEKSGEFQPGTDFRAWACRIAYFKVKTFARRNKDFSPVDERLLETLSAEADEMAERLDPRLGALADCLKKLSARDRQILDLRYKARGTARQTAEMLRCSLVGAYKALQRIHDGLFDCVERTLAREGR